MSNDPTNPPPRRRRGIAGLGVCPLCGRMISLRVDLRLRAHGVVPTAAAARCAGSGELPVEDPAGTGDPLLAPVEASPVAILPPYDVLDDRLDHLRGDTSTWRTARRLERLTVLTEPLAGLPISEYEHRILTHLAGADTPEVAVIAALLRRARAATS